MRSHLWSGLVGVVLSALVVLNVHAVSVDKKGNDWIIETDQYTLHWKTVAQAGYSQAIPAGGDQSLLGAGQGRNLYHSANYAGWKDWGGAKSVKEVEKGGGKLVMQYTMDDGGSKVYNCTATYWDGVPYFKHEIVVEAKGPVRSFSDGHDPMVEPRNGAKNKFQKWDTPFAHVAFENEAGFFAIYSETGTARTHDAWAPDGRMDLVHDAVAVNLKKGQKSDPLVYYLAVGSGGLKDAHALADIVTKEPAAALSVSAQGKLATAWADLKRP